MCVDRYYVWWVWSADFVLCVVCFFHPGWCVLFWGSVVFWFSGGATGGGCWGVGVLVEVFRGYSEGIQRVFGVIIMFVLLFWPAIEL